MTQALSVCQFNKAIVRAPAQSVVNGLRAGDGESPTYQGILAEHQAYVSALRAAGVAVLELPALEQFPDSIFVEDPALVFSEAAVLLRPGAPNRTAESAAIEATLQQQFERVYTMPPGRFAEGGDVLVTPEKVMIGLSNRTDTSGAEALGDILRKLGRKVEIVATPSTILHFKSDCGLLDEETVLTTARLAQTGVFDSFDQIITPPGEEGAANVLRINDIALLGDQFPRTAETLDKRGFNVLPIATSQIAKIDAGLSCMSLRWMCEPAN